MIADKAFLFVIEAKLVDKIFLFPDLVLHLLPYLLLLFVFIRTFLHIFKLYLN